MPSARDDPVRRKDHKEEPKTREEKSEGKLCGRRKIKATLRQSHPQCCEHWREHDDQKRIDRLKPRRRNLETSDSTAGEVASEQIERRRRLFERRPEYRRKNE